MKMMNKEGKVFNRINILDLIFIAAIMLLLFLSAIKIIQLEVVGVEVHPVYETNLDMEGNPVRSLDPTMEEARVSIEGTLPYESMSYKLGAQEVRQGKIIFIESDFYRLKGQIETIEVVN